MRYLLPLALLAATLAPAAAPPSTSLDDAHDLVVLTPKRPYRIRFHLRVANQSYLAGWNQQVGQLLRFLDVDGDGQLSLAEAARAPSREQWRQMCSSTSNLDPDAAPDFRELANGKPAASASDLRSYYANATGGPLQTTWSWGTTTVDQLSDKLWERLDTNRDGKLSRTELQAARRVLNILDRDEDEMVTMTELMGQFFADTPFVLASGPAHGQAMGGLPFLSLRPGEPGTEAIKKLGLSSAVDLELLVPLEGADHPTRVLSGPTAGLRFTTTRYGEAIVLDNWLIEIVRPRALPSRRPTKSTATSAAFRALDSDNNGTLDGEEVYRPPFTYVSWLRLADRDGDGKLSAAEFTAFADLKNSVQARVTSLRGEDLGQSLFRFLDEDGDGRLGPRELHQAWDRLTPCAQGRTEFARKELPRHFRLTLSHGALSDLPRQAEVTARARTEVPERGPLWFRKMDRNRDGDVSEKEWLGTAAQFRRIDADGDGLINLDEAERFDREQRNSVKR